MTDNKNMNIFDVANYKSKLSENDKLIVQKYKEIVNEYLFHLGENLLIQNYQYYIFILIRGLKTIKHIFNTLILYTKNLELTIYHTKKAYLFYVEFIGQIGEDNNSYLQLNSKDATLFVYKKTIFEINNDFRQSFIINEKEKILFEYINKVTKLINDIYEEVLNNENLKGKKKISYIMYCEKMAEKIINKVIDFDISLNEKIALCNSYFYFKNLLLSKDNKIDECLFFNLSNLFVKKYYTKKGISEEIINEKMYNNETKNKLEKETPLKFINWLFNRK